jgi:hypothetical protein
MPIDITQPGELHPGELFEDCRYHPCLCTEVGGDDDPSGVWGISLVDGRPVGCSVLHCGLRKLTLAEAVRWKQEGPADVQVEAAQRWW